MRLYVLSYTMLLWVNKTYAMLQFSLIQISSPKQDPKLPPSCHATLVRVALSPQSRSQHGSMFALSRGLLSLTYLDAMIHYNSVVHITGVSAPRHIRSETVGARSILSLALVWITETLVFSWDRQTDLLFEPYSISHRTTYWSQKHLQETSTLMNHHVFFSDPTWKWFLYHRSGATGFLTFFKDFLVSDFKFVPAT